MHSKLLCVNRACKKAFFSPSVSQRENVVIKHPDKNQRGGDRNDIQIKRIA